jgi:hypothetical protein
MRVPREARACGRGNRSSDSGDIPPSTAPCEEPAAVEGLETVGESEVGRLCCIARWSTIGPRT